MTLLFILVGVPIMIVAIVAFHDLTQRKHGITRNFPVAGHFRYWLEEMGHPLRQYLFAGDRDERPYNRVTHSWVYASAKGQNNLIGFGSQADHQELGRILIVASLYPTLARSAAPENDLPRPRVIGAKRGQPYQPRRFANISGMSFGALSANAVRALSRGARLVGCYMGTGEGSLTPYHLEGDCDILYQSRTNKPAVGRPGNGCNWRGSSERNVSSERRRRRSFARTVPRAGRRCQAHREMNVPLRRSLSA